jgi:hypothetical protein
MGVTLERVAWGGWQNCWRLANGDVELIVTGDVGPRIMRYAYPGGSNPFAEFADELGQSGEKNWRLRGGTRLWAAPEIYPGSYPADNFPVDVQEKQGGLIAIAPLEATTGLQKTIEVDLDETGTHARITYRIANRLQWPIEVSAWVLSMMTTGGLGISGFPPRGTHPEVLPPTHPLVMWAFTDLTDPRWRITKKYVTLRQDAGHPAPTKIGHFNRHTWGAFLLDDLLYLKRYRGEEGKVYPDIGCSFEMFANDRFLELETLSPMTRLGPGEELAHVEDWWLYRGVRLPKVDDDSLDAALLPILDETLHNAA